MLSLVVPIYRDAENVDRLLAALVDLDRRLAGDLEVVLVADGSPDASLSLLREKLPELGLRYQLLALSRNFGSFNAIAAGMEAGRGDYFAVLAADLQEPPQLILDFHDALLRDRADIVFGYRVKRNDPWFSELSSGAFWWLYRKLVMPDIPPGGVDVFGCTRTVRDHVLRLKESETNLVMLLFWLGFRRQFIPYERLARQHGSSAWTFSAKLRYSLNSIFNFTDLPVRMLMLAGVVSFTLAMGLAGLLLAARLGSPIPLPEHALLLLAILLLGSAVLAGLGVVGHYLWLSLQNARGRPNFVVATREENAQRESRVRK